MADGPPTTDPALKPDFTKVDSALLSDLEDCSPEPDSKAISLFINTYIVPNPDQVKELAALGVNGTDRQTTLFTARLSPNEIIALSHKTWVKRLRGSNQARPS